MREALLKKRYGIPVALLIAILIGAGIVVAAFTYVSKVKPTVQWPVSENSTVFFNVASGHTFTKENWLDLVLLGKYNLTYKLTGDTNDNLKDESATIGLDLNDSGTIEASESKTINALDGTVTFSGISKTQINQLITISATARENVLVTVYWETGDLTPIPGITKTTLKVSMKASKA